MNLKDLMGETVLGDLENVTSALKLRELIEKKILEKNSELQKIIHIEHGLKSCGSDYHLQILNERDAYQQLLEESKK